MTWIKCFEVQNRQHGEVGLIFCTFDLQSIASITSDRSGNESSQYLQYVKLFMLWLKYVWMQRC